MRAVIVQHEEHEGEGWFGPALVQAGFELVHRFRTVAPADVAAELVVVLGGTMSACVPHDHPFLEHELVLLADRLRRGAPCLGICLGAQLVARAAGGVVSRGANGLEVGPLPVRWTKAAEQDPVLAGPTGSMVVAHWHEDTWAQVPGAALMASSDRYEQQAFRLGASYAFQFHLELGSAAFARWLAAGHDGLAAAGCDMEAMSAALPALAAGDAARQALVGRLAEHFAARARPGRPR